MKLCDLSPLLEAAGVPIPVYRGLMVQPGTKEGDVLTIQIRQDRKPSDLSVMVSACFNYGIEQLFGIPEIRKRACFASTNKANANKYARDVIKRKRGTRGALTQLMVPSGTDVIFHPGYDDSLDLKYSFDLMDQVGNLWVADHPDKTVADFKAVAKAVAPQYLSTNAMDFWQLLLDATFDDKSQHPALREMFHNAAVALVKGYQRLAPDTDFGKRPNVEIIIHGITQCEAKVIKVVYE